MGAGDGSGPRRQQQQRANGSNGSEKPVKAAAKTAANSSFGANMPLMSSAFDTAMWLWLPSLTVARRGRAPPIAAARPRYSSTEHLFGAPCTSNGGALSRPSSQDPGVAQQLAALRERHRDDLAQKRPVDAAVFCSGVIRTTAE